MTMSGSQTLGLDTSTTPSRSFVHASWFRKTVLLAAVYLVVLLLVQADVINDYRLITIATICINIVLATSLNLITGFTGQFSLGHAGFMAIGAYVTALVTIQIDSVWGFVLGLLAGALLASLVGLLIGLPTLRLRGDYLAIVTLGMAEIIRIVLLNLKVTNGAAGLQGIPQFVNWTWLFILTAGSVVLISNYLHSRHGRDSIAVREDEIAAESIGVNSTRTKTMSFMVGAFFGGIAGDVRVVLLLHQAGHLQLHEVGRHPGDRGAGRTRVPVGIGHRGNPAGHRVNAAPALPRDSHDPVRADPDPHHDLPTTRTHGLA